MSSDPRSELRDRIARQLHSRRCPEPRPGCTPEAGDWDLADAVMELIDEITEWFTYLDGSGQEWPTANAPRNARCFMLRTAPEPIKEDDHARDAD